MVNVIWKRQQPEAQASTRGGDLMINGAGYGAWQRPSHDVLAVVVLGGGDPMLVVQNGYVAVRESCGLAVDTK